MDEGFDFCVVRGVVIEKIQVKYANWIGKGDKTDAERLTATLRSPNFDTLFVISEDGERWHIPDYVLEDIKGSFTLASRNGERRSESKYDTWRIN